MSTTASMHSYLEIRYPETGFVGCFRHEGDKCPRCDGSGYRPRKRCVGCGEHRSLMRNPADDEMYCLSCNPRFFGAGLTLFKETGG